MKKKQSILVVDDVPLNLRFVYEIFKDDYSVFMAKSGEQAFKMLEKNQPGLILLDVKMPDMDGFEVLKKIKEDEKYANIPVIMLTGDYDEEVITRSTELNAFSVIKKPFDTEDLKQRINEVMNG